MPCVQSSRFVFTDFPPPPVSMEAIDYFSEDVVFCAYQYELCPRTGRVHIQGYAKFKSRNTTVKKVQEACCAGRKAHVEKARGTDEEAVAYCSKEDTRVAGPFTYGVLLKSGDNVKKRKMISCEQSPERMFVEDPDLYSRVMSLKRRSSYLSQEPEIHSLRSWQEMLVDRIDEYPDDRTIYWAYGPNGNEGKSTFARDLEKQGWFVIAPKPVQDMMYLYHEHMINPDPGFKPHVALDIPRCVPGDSMQHVYQFIEDVKNRRIVSTKYRPVKYTDVNRVHVLVLSNVLPDFEKISEDRVRVIDISSIPEVDPTD
jgi:Putative viral replication protein